MATTLPFAQTRAAKLLGKIRQPWPPVLVLAVVTVVSRFPSVLWNGMFDRDESYLAVTGDVIRNGGGLYHQVIDRKPPIVPYFYAVIRDLSVDMRWVRLAAAILIFVNGVIVMAIARRLNLSRNIATVTGALAIAGTAMFFPADGQAANFELWGLAPASLAIYCALRARQSVQPERWFMLAAFSAVVAANCKQPYIVVLAVVFYEATRHAQRARTLIVTALSSISLFALVWLLFGNAYLRWTWIDNSDYVDGGVSLLRAFGVGFGLSLVFLLFHLPLFYGLWAAFTKRVRIDTTIIIWLVLSAAVIPIGFRFFGHYYQQVVPALAITTGIALQKSSPRVVKSVVVMTAAILMVLLTLSVVYRPDLSNFTSVGRRVQALTNETDRIYVWGALPDVYVASQRLPAGVFLHGGYLTGNWASRQSDLENIDPAKDPFRSRWQLFFDDVQNNPPAVIVDGARLGTDWGPAQMWKYPIGDWLSRCYQLDSDNDRLPIWVLDRSKCGR